MRALILQICLGFAYGNELHLWIFQINVFSFFSQSHLQARLNLSTLPCTAEVAELLAALMLPGVSFSLKWDIATQPETA